MNRFSIVREFHHCKTVLSGLSRLSALLLLCLLLLGTVQCGGGGGGDGTNTGTTIGPGDPDNYFPFEQGNTWITKGAVVSEGITTEYYSITKISGSKDILGKTAAVWTKIWIPRDSSGLLFLDQERRETYLFKDDKGITYLGNNNPLDTLTPEIVPYYNAMFPIEAGSSFEQLNRVESNYSAFSRVTVKGLDEEIRVPVDIFPQCAIIYTDLSATISGFTSAATQTQWFAKGIGSVMSITETIENNVTSANTEELFGYVLAGGSSGVTPLTPGFPPSSGTVKRNSVNFYIVGVAPDMDYTITLTGMSGTVNNLFALNGSTTMHVTDSITIPVTDSVLYIMVDGFNLSADEAQYTIQVSEQVSQQ